MGTSRSKTIKPRRSQSQKEALTYQLVSTFIMLKLQKQVQDVVQRLAGHRDLEVVTKSNEFQYLFVNATTRRDLETSIVGVVGGG